MILRWVAYAAIGLAGALGAQLLRDHGAVEFLYPLGFVTGAIGGVVLVAGVSLAPRETPATPDKREHA